MKKKSSVGSLSISVIMVMFVLIAFLASCTTTKTEYSGPKVKLFTKNVSFNITKSSAHDKFLPDGFLLYFIRIFDEKGEGLTDPKMVKEVQILDPTGAVFKTLSNSEYIHYATSELSGYSKTNDGCIWMGFDTAFNLKTLPAAGNYRVVVTSISGNKESTTISFNPQKIDPITGYPSAIKYDSKTRTITWNPTSGQTGYIVSIYKGDFKPGTDLSSRVSVHGLDKDNRITEPKFIIPDKVALQNNEKYYVEVEAYWSDGNAINYVHTQTNLADAAIFSGDGKGVAAQKKEMSK